MQGHRLPDGVSREFVKPGDMYRWRPSKDALWRWAVRDPDGDFGDIDGYEVFEHRDRSISVRGELVNQSNGERWKLEAGFWTRVTRRPT